MAAKTAYLKSMFNGEPPSQLINYALIETDTEERIQQKREDAQERLGRFMAEHLADIANNSLSEEAMRTFAEILADKFPNPMDILAVTEAIGMGDAVFDLIFKDTEDPGNNT